MKPEGLTIRTPALDRCCMRPGHHHRKGVKRIGRIWNCEECVLRVEADVRRRKSAKETR